LKSAAPASVGVGKIEHMFESTYDGALQAAIATLTRACAIASAHKYTAIAELERLRNTGEHAKWAGDTTDAVAAEVAAVLHISHEDALREVRLAVTLRDEFSKVAALFAGRASTPDASGGSNNAASGRSPKGGRVLPNSSSLHADRPKTPSKSPGSRR
jgi:hypothetical protein